MEKLYERWSDIRLRQFMNYLLIPSALQQDSQQDEDLSFILNEIDHWRA